MSHVLPPFDMFKTQEAGFTEAFVKEFDINFEQHMDMIINILKGDEYFDLDARQYDLRKGYFKKVVGDIKEYFDSFIRAHMDFLEEQEKVVYELCGIEYEDFKYFSRFDGLIQFMPEMSETVRGFFTQCDECAEEIDNMVRYEDLNEEKHNEYKSNFSEHIIGLGAKSKYFIDLLMKQHVSNTWEEVGRLHRRYATLKSEIQSTIEQAEERQQVSRKEVNDKTEKLHALIHKISDPTSIVDIIIEEMEKLKISETLRKVENRFSYWSKYIENNKSQLTDTCDRLYESELAFNGVRMKGLVDLRTIKKLSLTEETEKQIASITDEMRSVLLRCRELSEEELDALKKVIGPGEGKQD